MIARRNESIFIGVLFGAVTLTLIFSGSSSRNSSFNDDVSSVITKRVYYNDFKVDSHNAGQYGVIYPKLTERVFNDFDIASKVCGFHKCFFLSKTYENCGYLVTPRGLLPNSKQSYELAKKMEEKDSAFLQPLLTAPELVHLSQEMSEKLGERHYENQMFEPGEIVVSKSRNIHDAVVMGCNMKNGKNSDELKNLLPQWIEEAEDPDLFFYNFRNSLHATKLALQDHPCLFLDMHVMVDKHGSAHNIDLDRCYHSDEQQPTEEMVKCINSLSFLQRMAEHLVKKQTEERNALERQALEKQALEKQKLENN